mgnify:CR=1 FL=1
MEQPPLLPGHAPRKFARGTVIGTARIVPFTRGGLNLRFIPFLAGPRTTCWIFCATEVPYCLNHAQYQRYGRGDILPRRCPPPTCRRSLPHPLHPHPPSAPHRPHRRNGHSPSCSLHHPHRGHRNARGASRRLSHPRHYTAPSVEHRNGTFLAGNGLGSGPPPSLERRELAVRSRSKQNAI